MSDLTAPEHQAKAPPIGDFDSLLANLDHQGALYDALLDLSDREREAIGRADLTQLSHIVTEKERIIAEAQRLEQARQEACARWAREWGMAQHPTIGDMRARARTTELAERLDAAALALSSRVQRLRQINQRNAHLIQQAQRVGEQVISIALRYGHHPTYGSRGDAAQIKRPSVILDYRV
jgi:flagellar biosynthesis/type III secretory pathway chaperone